MIPSARIENWQIVNDICFGQVFDDTSNRFGDGEHIFTTEVMSFVDNIITTRNSVYELGTPADTSY